MKNWKQEAEVLFRDITDTHNLETMLQWSEDVTGGALANYDPSKDLVTLFEVKIKRAMGETGWMSYPRILVAHELGHAFDEKNREGCTMFNRANARLNRCAETGPSSDSFAKYYRKWAVRLLDLEEEAWKHAERFLGVAPLEFSLIKDTSLCSYKKTVPFRYKGYRLAMDISDELERLVEAGGASGNDFRTHEIGFMKFEKEKLLVYPHSLKKSNQSQLRTKTYGAYSILHEHSKKRVGDYDEEYERQYRFMHDKPQGFEKELERSFVRMRKKREEQIEEMERHLKRIEDTFFVYTRLVRNRTEQDIRDTKHLMKRMETIS
ncbi:hypothetical protein IMZ31_22675 (plasmid) [Pontibacillus sp. ALD_SL1]|uniref:hypothetical protein n=1 Tax=Pontibacillus sp. ALD_SL1 TaxID=2777185 RepID=UPI001A969265|nr:hypothetical protein [Pontibacillus sp. ALD_SL1]QST02262.1 hypothetical protein IMZ31_22675 [Pontibacillus sp. ALD_SL1]